MATPPTFSSGAVLTAAQMNSVGLWLVKTQTVGNAVTSVTVTGAFSADYDSYKIIYTGGSGTINDQIRMTLGGSTGGYYSALNYVFYSGGTGVLTGNGIAYWNVGSQKTVGNSIDIDIHNPFLGDETWFNGHYVGVQAGGVVGAIAGYHDQGLSYSAFTLTAGAGTITGGTIKVYGYRN
jgi:hypothetical protein